MKRKRHSSEQVIRKLRQAEAELAGGRTLAEVCARLEVSEWTFSRWRKQYGRVETDQARRLKEFERENARLKKLVAGQALNMEILREAAGGNF